MKRLYKIHLSLVAMLAVTACLPQRLHAQYWTNGQAASFVIGQTGFGLNGAALSAAGLTEAASVAVDPASGKVFVSDFLNNRVLRYPSIAAMSDGVPAEAVLGQPDFMTNVILHGFPASPTTFCDPFGLAVDSLGNLWVVDEENDRVLRFANAATIASGAAASGVLGWPDLVSNEVTNNGDIEPPTAASLYFPSAVFCKGTTLWVADFGNNRILRFDNAASKANGANADAVFGTPNFVDLYQGDEAQGSFNLWGPGQIYVDGSDNLWEVELYNNRVMMFPNASTGGNNASTTGVGVQATLVLGQASFYSGSAGTTASSMNTPYGVYGDPAGNIYVGDFGNNRIMVFAHAANLSNGAAATYVLGQTDFVSNGSGDNASQLSGPALLFIPTSGTMLMAPDALNNRVLTYIPVTPLALSLISFTGQLQESGQVLLQWQISDVGVPGGHAAYTELEYATNAVSGFSDVLNQQLVSPATQHCSYLQVSPVAGTHYYRLKLILPDGAATYSQIVVITVGSGEIPSMGLSIYPNPAQHSVVVDVPQTSGATAGTAEIDIYSTSGMLMQRLVTGAAVNNIDISRWAAGMYIVKVVQGRSTVSGSFIKEH